MWCRELGIQKNDKVWDNLYPDILRITKSTRLKYFHYRLINKRFTTNISRRKWDPDTSDRCTFCKQVPEMVLHFLWECPEVIEIWTNFQKWLSYILGFKFTLDRTTMICNNYKGPFGDLLNTLILITKHYIYATKCNKEDHTLRFLSLTQRFYEMQNIERIIALRNNKWHKYNRKWTPLDGLS